MRHVVIQDYYIRPSVKNSQVYCNVLVYTLHSAILGPLNMASRHSELFISSHVQNFYAVFRKVQKFLYYMVAVCTTCSMYGLCTIISHTTCFVWGS